MTAKHNTARVNRGAKAKRSEIVTVRFNPRVRFLLELAARAEQRTVSSYIEIAVQERLTKTVVVRDPAGHKEATSIAKVASQLWDPLEPDRFVRLAALFPELLSPSEELLWKIVNETVWQGRKWPNDDPDQFNIPLEELQTLRRRWDELKSVADSAVNTTQILDRAEAVSLIKGKTGDALRDEVISLFKAQLEREYPSGKDVSKTDPTQPT